MTRQVTDQLYIELDYYYPEEYYVYIAEAQSAQNANLSLSCSADLISPPIEAAAALSVSVSQSATATRIKEFSVAVDNLFSSSITVVAQLAGVALLESQSTMSIAPVVNRSAAITLSNLVNVSSQAQYTASFTSNLTATVSQTTLGGPVITAESAFSSQTSLNVSRYASFPGRPINLTGSGTYQFYTEGEDLGNSISGDVIYGTHGLFLRGNSGTAVSASSNRFLIEDGQPFVIEFWWTPTTDRNGTHDPIIAKVGGSAQTRLSNMDSTDYWAIGVAANSRLVFKFRTGVSTFITITGNQNNLSVMQHIAVQRGTDGIIRLRRNNSQIGSTTYTGALYAPSSDNLTLRLLSADWNIPSGSGYGVMFDEFSYKTDDSTIRGYSSGPIANEVPYHVTLQHFDNNFNDDIYVVESATASLSADAAISAQADANTKLASASLSASATQTTQVTAVKEATASLSAATTQTTQGIRVRYADSTQSADFTQSTVIGSIKQFAVTVDSLFTSSLDVVAQLAGVALLETTATVTAQAVKTVDSQSTQSAQFAQSAAILYTAGSTSNQSADFTQSTLGERIRFGVASQTSEFTQSTTGNKIPPFSAVLAVTASVSVNIDKLKLSASDLTVEFAQAAQAAKTTDVESTQTSAFTQTADTIRVRFADSTQTVAFAQNTEAVKTVDVISTEQADFTQTTSPVKTAVATVNNMVLFGSAIDADLTARPLVYLESTASLSALIGVIKEFVPNSITGVRPRINATKSSAPYILAVGPQFTASIWFRKNSLTDSSGPIWSTSTVTSAGNLPAFARRLEYYGDTGLRYVYVQTGASNPFYQPSWPNSIPNDTEWHHALIRITSVGASQRWDLWVDGLPQTPYTTSNIPLDHNIWAQNADEAVTGFKLGHTIPGNGESGVDTELDGDLAQIWIGEINSNQFTPSLFYNGGAKDLGTLGTAGGQLPTPWLYNSLDTPYQNLLNSSGLASPINSANQVLPLPDLAGDFQLTASFVGVFLFVWNVNSEFAQTATATRVLAGYADLSATATISATVNGEFGGSSDLTATVTASATISKTTGYQSALAAQADFEVQPGLFELGQADLTDEFDLVCDFDAVPPTRGEAALSAEFNITIDASSFTDATVLHLGEFTQVCEATLIPPIRTGADLTATATLSATIGTIEQFASLVQSSGTVIATASVTRTTSSDLDSEFTESITGQRVRFGVISISALHATVTAGDVINLDPFLTLTIPQETGILRVKAESRGLIIQQETRSLIIEGWE